MQSQAEHPESQSILNSPVLIWPGFFKDVTIMATHEQMKIIVTLLLLPFLEKVSTSTLDCRFLLPLRTVLLWIFTLASHLLPLIGGL